MHKFKKNRLVIVKFKKCNGIKHVSLYSMHIFKKHFTPANFSELHHKFALTIVFAFNKLIITYPDFNYNYNVWIIQKL
jgi:hypothetical protein